MRYNSFEFIALILFTAAICCTGSFYLGKKSAEVNIPQIQNTPIQIKQQNTIPSDLVVPSSYAGLNSQTNYLNTHEINSSHGEITIDKIQDPLAIANIVNDTTDPVVDKIITIKEYSAVENNIDISPYMTVTIFNTYPIGKYDTPCKMLSYRKNSTPNNDIGGQTLKINGYTACQVNNNNGEIFAVVNNSKAVLFDIRTNISGNPRGLFTYQIDGTAMQPIFETVVKSIKYN